MPILNSSRKELMSRDELSVMDGSKCILQLRFLQNEGRESPRFQPWDDRPTIMVFFVFANIIVM